MTVAYNFDISSSSWSSITKVLLRWRGSVWKAVTPELLFWFTIYAVLNFSLRTLLNQHQTENFKVVRVLLADCLPRIPLSLLLGFFVNVVFGRWSEIFRRIGFIDNVALVVAHLVKGDDPETRLLRRKIVRYAVLSQTLVFRDISLEVRKRFPDIEAVVNAGIMTEHEYDLLTSKVSRNSKYWIPIQWAMKLVWKAREQEKIVNDVVAFQLTEKLREFRTDLQMLCCFDWVPVPLAYPQIVILAVRCYMLITVIARQTLGNEFIIPCMTILELILLMGWVKVAETLLNPLGTDDDDFECNYVIDRNLSLGFEIVDGIPMPSPDDVDIFWTVESPLPLDNILHSKKRHSTYAGSVADIDVMSMEKQHQMSTNTSVTRQSTLRRRVSKKPSHDQISQEFPTIVEEGSIYDMTTVVKKLKTDLSYFALVQNNLPEHITSEIQSVLARYADEWSPRETYYLLKYALEACKHDDICYLLVSKKMDDLCRVRFFFRSEDYFTVERCKKRMETLLDATKDSPDIPKTSFKYTTPVCLNPSAGDDEKYSLQAHIAGILQDLIKCNKEVKDEFFTTPEKFELVLKYVRGDVTPESIDAVCSAVDAFNQIIIDTTPEEAFLCSNAERSITKKELEQVENYEDFQDLVTYRMNLLDDDRVPRRTTAVGDEQLMTLWENRLTQPDAPQSPPNVEIPPIPRTSSLPPGDFSTSPLPLPPPPPSVPPMDSTLSSSMTEPSEIDTSGFISLSAPRLSTPPLKDISPNDSISPSDSAKKSRGRPKKSNLTLEIPPAIPTKKSRISSREPSETPKGNELKTPDSAALFATTPARIGTNKISSSASTPELGSASITQSSTGRSLRPSQRRQEDLPVREARKRAQTFYTPTNSPIRHGSPTRQLEDIQIGDNSQDSSRGSVSRPGSSIPASAKSSAPQSARTSEERTKVESRLITRSMPLVKPEPDKKVVNEQTFLTVPYKVGTIADTKPVQRQKLKIYRKRGNISKEGGTRSQGVQTGPMYLENNFLRWNDATSKSSALAKSVLKSCYGPTSKYIREKTCKVHFSVERRSVIDLPVALRNHKCYDVIQQMKKLDLDDPYQLPARMVEPKYRRLVKKPMDQLTIKELMVQGQIKNPIDMALNCVLMCANHVVLNSVKKENRGLKTAQTVSVNVHQILRRMKD